MFPRAQAEVSWRAQTGTSMFGSFSLEDPNISDNGKLPIKRRGRLPLRSPQLKGEGLNSPALRA